MLPKNQDIADAELVARARANPDDYALIVDRYGAAILRYVSRITDADPAEADDIAQTVMVKAYLNLAGYDPSVRFSSWLYRIAHNAAVDAWRKRSRRESLSLDGDDENRLADMLSDGTDVHRDVADADRREAVRRAIASLDRKYREILVLRYLDDRSYEEISDILKVPVGTVSTLAHRAKASFAKAWSNFYRGN